MLIIWNQALILFVVMCLAALACLFSEKCGIVNISVNGVMIVGSFTYWLVASKLHGGGYYQLVHLLCAMLAGILTSLIFGIAVIYLRANQIIAGTAINMFASATGLFLLRFYGAASNKVLKDFGWSLSSNLNSFANSISLALLCGLVIILLSWVVLKFTTWGLRFKATGENPYALESQGVNVFVKKIQGLVISGAIAGIAGGILVQQVGSFNGNVQGLGFVGLTILIAGQWKVVFIVLAACVFAFLFSLAQNISIISASLNYVYPLIQITPFLLALIFQTIFSKSSRAPQAIGVPFLKKS